MTATTTRLLSLVSLFLAIGCSDSKRLPAVDLQGSTMGTAYAITLIAAPDEVSLESLRIEINEQLSQIEDLASTYRATSQLSIFNNNPSTDWIPVSAAFCNAISDALTVSQLTDGAFDITIGSLVNIWGFGPDDITNEAPSALRIQDLMKHVGHRGLSVDCDRPAVRKSSGEMYIDLSGWAKGHAVDRVSMHLESSGLENFIVEIGGELRVKGHNAEKKDFAIAIENPRFNASAVPTVIRITDAAVATSGDYRNFRDVDGERYSHTIDPRTGRPIDHELSAVTVISESAAYADAMATALLVLGPADGMAMSDRLGVAALFAINTAAGIELQSTTEFDELSR